MAFSVTYVQRSLRMMLVIILFEKGQLNNTIPEAEFKEFERRLKFKLRLKFFKFGLWYITKKYFGP